MFFFHDGTFISFKKISISQSVQFCSPLSMLIPSQAIIIGNPDFCKTFLYWSSCIHSWPLSIYFSLISQSYLSKILNLGLQVLAVWSEGPSSPWKEVWILFQMKRKAIKEFWGGEVTCNDLPFSRFLWLLCGKMDCREH